MVTGLGWGLRDPRVSLSDPGNRRKVLVRESLALGRDQSGYCTERDAGHRSRGPAGATGIELESSYDRLPPPLRPPLALRSPESLA